MQYHARMLVWPDSSLAIAAKCAGNLGDARARGGIRRALSRYLDADGPSLPARNLARHHELPRDAWRAGPRTAGLADGIAYFPALFGEHAR